MARLSTSEYLELLNVLAAQVNALEPYQLASLSMENLSPLEGDRLRVLAAVAGLKTTLTEAVAAAQRAAQ